MSIAPPSDIVLDVAQAADPTRVQAAAAKLASMASGSTGDIDFSAILELRSKPTVASSQTPTVHAPEVSRGHQLTARPGSPYQKFEAVVLQNFVQSILPKDSDLFGDAFSADAYRSMLAEQVATQVAKSGRLGIAHAIEVKEDQLHPKPVAVSAPEATVSGQTAAALAPPLNASS